MEDVPKGYRDPEEEHLFRSPSKDPGIHPDIVSPCVEGYFTLPAVWIGEAPNAEAVREFNPEAHYEVVISRELSANVEVWVLRDGTFLFDFTEWPIAPTITIPGYRNPEPGNWRTKVPAFYVRAEAKAEEYAALRAQLMNVHQLCLIAATKMLKKCSFGRWHPVTAWNTLKSAQLSAPPSHPNYNDPYSILRLAIGSRFGLDESAKDTRLVVDADVAEKSLDLLDAVLQRGNRKTIVVLEAIFLAGCRTFDRRFGEALVLAWGVCEQMLSLLWQSLLSDNKEMVDGEHPRMSADRRKKLIGRDYTASVMIEVLELEGRIDHHLYRELEVARKARNKWMHEMALPKSSEVKVCIEAAQRLVFQVWNLDMPTFFPQGPGAVPGWFIWVWEAQKKRKAPTAPQ
ncbi:hypothetical protein MTMN5_01831 [Marinobacter salarius]|nr:hypothetical protein MTMN5_01831 [Marinobacter salarius]